MFKKPKQLNVYKSDYFTPGELSVIEQSLKKFKETVGAQILEYRTTILEYSQKKPITPCNVLSIEERVKWIKEEELKLKRIQNTLDKIKKFSNFYRYLLFFDASDISNQFCVNDKTLKPSTIEFVFKDAFEEEL